MTGRSRTLGGWEKEKVAFTTGAIKYNLALSVLCSAGGVGRQSTQKLDLGCSRQEWQSAAMQRMQRACG